MKKIAAIFLAGLVLVGLMADASAQDVEPQPVTILAADGLELVGDYSIPVDQNEYPSVLLLHMLNSSRQGWDPLIPVLVENGFAVLAIDMRGHGETGGEMNWALAEQDVQAALDWLKDRNEVTYVTVVGASIGANLALRAGANDSTVSAVVALSPGLDYRGVTTEDAIEGLADGDVPALLIAARDDTFSAESVLALFTLSTGDIAARLYVDNRHGTGLFWDNEPLLQQIVNWLIEYTPD